MTDDCEEYGLVSIHQSEPKQAILRTGFDFNVFFGFSLSGHLRTVGFNALTCFSTISKSVRSVGRK